MARLTVSELVSQLQLAPHPEGGFYRETFRDAGVIPGAALPSAYAGTPRSFSTAIYFLVPAGSFSRLHRISSAEVWHFYAGDPLVVVEVAPDGAVTHTTLGQDMAAGQRVQHVVPGGHWFGCHPARDSADAAAVAPADERSYSLVGCTVAPGFDFADFEMAKRSELLRLFPHATADVMRLTDAD